MKKEIFLWQNGRLYARRTALVELASFPTAASISVLPGSSLLSPLTVPPSSPSLGSTAADCHHMVGCVGALVSAAL